ncbi:DMT family transporter [Pseudoalteromonas rubra]|uniref:EamA family transporter n=1 Tax=Pseudoalteromonas rubra TaxID=43658 RepID=A0A5S3WZR8_9GAMM|nr:DMT family transporter [Pseudoalteromonas rubra]TMP36548.1 EamA family transporter [Pseudoalteromonas rubra]
MRPEQSSLVNLHLAVLLFGGTALFSKLISLSALDITVYRTAIAFATLAGILAFKGSVFRLNAAKDYAVVVLLGICVGLHWVTYFAAMQMAGIAVGVIAFFTYPVITVLLEPLFFRSRLKRKDVFTAIVVMLGIYLLVPSSDPGNQITLGILTGVISGVLFALRNLLQKKLFSSYGGPHTMFYQTLIAALMLCAFVEVPPTELSTDNLILIVLAGCVFTAIPHALFASSLRYLSATTAGLISCLQPLYATVLAYMLLAETITLTTLAGGVLVVSAACYETWSITRNKL